MWMPKTMLVISLRKHWMEPYSNPVAWINQNLLSVNLFITNKASSQAMHAVSCHHTLMLVDKSLNTAMIFPLIAWELTNSVSLSQCPCDSWWHDHLVPSFTILSLLSYSSLFFQALNTAISSELRNYSKCWRVCHISWQVLDLRSLP